MHYYSFYQKQLDRKMNNIETSNHDGSVALKLIDDAPNASANRTLLYRKNYSAKYLVQMPPAFGAILFVTNSSESQRILKIL